MTGVVTAPSLIRSKRIPIAKPNINSLRINDGTIFRTGFRTLEDTGYGDLLCYESYGARPFLSSEKEARAGVQRFVDKYKYMCKLYDNDPDREHCEIMNFNELYHELHILESTFGKEWGYSINGEYRVMLQFKIWMLENTVGTYFQNMADKVLMIEPWDQYCTPFNFYMWRCEGES